jgi:lipid II:glycine glycyltransferase (peptidoglycan interpeptide bridge formation enzyme)
MIIIARKILFFKDKLVFFPNKEELNSLIKNLGNFEILRIKETDIELPESLPPLISRGIFRTSILDLKKDLKEIWKEMDKSSCRYEINKAKKWRDKIEILINQNLDDFLKIYNQFVKKKKHTFSLSKKRLNDYLKFSDIFILYFEGEPAICHLVLKDKDLKILRLILSATRRLENEKYREISGPLNRYLHWFEIQYYKKLGFKTYDTGGVGSGEKGVGFFKLSFGGRKIEKRNYILGKSFVKFSFKIYFLIQNLKSLILYKRLWR